MRRFAPLFVVAALFLLGLAGCSSSSADCYFDGVVVDCSVDYCKDTCDDPTTGDLICTDTYSDDNNCGGCGIVCDATDYCWNYACVSGTCEDAGYTTCPSGCSDLTDVFNCGDCGVECANGCDASVSPPVCY